MISYAVTRLVIMVFLITAFIVGGGTHLVTRWVTPTHEEVEQEKARQKVIDTLTPEQREALGV